MYSSPCSLSAYSRDNSFWVSFIFLFLKVNTVSVKTLRQDHEKHSMLSILCDKEESAKNGYEEKGGGGLSTISPARSDRTVSPEDWTQLLHSMVVVQKEEAHRQYIQLYKEQGLDLNLCSHMLWACPPPPPPPPLGSC